MLVGIMCKKGKKWCQTCCVRTSRLSRCALWCQKRYVPDQMSLTATEDVRTLRRLFACVACKQEVKTEQTHGTKAKPFSEIPKITDKIYFLFKLIASGWTRQGRKTNKVYGIKQRLSKQKQQMSFLDRKCVFFVQRKYKSDWLLTQKCFRRIRPIWVLNHQPTVNKWRKIMESNHRLWQRLSFFQTNILQNDIYCLRIHRIGTKPIYTFRFYLN